MELNEAIAVELKRSEGEVGRTTQAGDHDGAQAQNNQPAPRYPLQFAVDWCEDLVVRKPTVKDTVKAVIAKNYAANNITQAKLRQDPIDRKLALERVTRRNKKAQKRTIKKFLVRMDSRPSGLDPTSDNEETHIENH